MIKSWLITLSSDKKNRGSTLFSFHNFFVTQLCLFALFVKARTRVLETETVMIS